MQTATKDCLCTSFSAGNTPSLRVQSGEAFVMETNDRFATYDGPGSSCLLYTSPSPRDLSTSRMPSSA